MIQSESIMGDTREMEKEVKQPQECLFEEGLKEHLFLTTSKQAASLSRTRLYWWSCCTGQYNSEARSLASLTDWSDS